MSSTTNVISLFQSAHQSGELSKVGLATLAIPSIALDIEEALGIQPLQVSSSEVLLIGILIDDSGSIRFAGNAQLVREGHNELLASYKESNARDSILVHCRYLNGTVLYPFVPLDQAVEMTSANYDPMGGTPLYDQTLVLWGTMVAKALELRQYGIVVRTASAIITDGHDEGSRKSVDDCCTLAQDILLQERHILAGVGVKDGQTDFDSIFAEMGIPPEWRLTPDNSKSEFRRAFQLWSRTTIRASQNAAAFSQVKVGGFAAVSP